jgi:hypothetical protein
MAKKDPKVSDYIDSCAPFAEPILKYLRKTVHKACPKASEALKWGHPHFLYEGKLLCGMAEFKAHCGFNFWHGRAVVPGEPTQGFGQFGKVASLKDLPSEKKLVAFVKKAMKLVEAELD